MGAGPVALLPLRDSAFALRECVKHLCLLEDHLVHEDRRCADCIGKHCLTAEAFADEAVQLAGGGDAAAQAAQEIRALWANLRRGAIGANEAAWEVRTLRKRLYSQLPAEGRSGEHG